jgi:hypothetical protein
MGGGVSVFCGVGDGVVGGASVGVAAEQAATHSHSVKHNNQLGKKRKLVISNFQCSISSVPLRCL